MSSDDYEEVNLLSSAAQGSSIGSRGNVYDVNTLSQISTTLNSELAYFIKNVCNRNYFFTVKFKF